MDAKSAQKNLSRKTPSFGTSRRQWLKSTAGGGALAALSSYSQLPKLPDGGATAEPRSAGIRKALLTEDGTSEIFAKRASDYLKQILEVTRGPGGLIIAFTVFETRLPLQANSALSPILHREPDTLWGPAAPKPTVADYFYGENTLWATGWLLWSQMLRYKVTREQEALAIARKCFQDINHVFDIDRPLDPGVLGKPHGGRGGKTTSMDQSANPILLYVQFAKGHGSPEEKEMAKKNMTEHGDYYLRKNWVVNQHGNLDKLLPPRHPSAMKYFAAVHAAYDMTGETRFHDAVEPLVREVIARKVFPWPSKQYELNANLFYYAWLAEYWSTTSLADAYDWISSLPVYWEAAQKGLDDEGLLLDGIYDTETKAFTPVREGYQERPTPGYRLASSNTYRWYRSPTGYELRTLYCLMVALLGLTVRKHGFDDKAHELSRKILLRISGDTLRLFWDNGRLPSELLPLTNLFGAEFPALWLIAYWMGRDQGVW